MNAENYTGNIKHKTDRLFESLHQDAALLFNTLMGYNVPDNLIDIIFSNITEISLREMSGPSPEFIPGPAWSNWENLGGHLTFCTPALRHGAQTDLMYLEEVRTVPSCINGGTEWNGVIGKIWAEI